MNDRIKIAEAMGWERTSYTTSAEGVVHTTRWRDLNGTCGQCKEDTPDPFTDANDDYAVLEHYRNKWSFNVALNEKQLGSYKVGDYARAALKVIA